VSKTSFTTIDSAQCVSRDPTAHFTNPLSHFHFSECRMLTRGSPRFLASAACIRLQPRMAPTSRTASSRLDQISKHLNSKPFLELNTPFSTERSARLEDERGNIRRKQPQEQKIAQQIEKAAPEAPKKMSKQPNHPALLIPGPIEFDDDVLSSMSHHRCAQPPCAHCAC
jgi:hypothetical protein